MAFADSGGYELQALAGDAVGKIERQSSALAEDNYWAGTFWKEPYFRADYDYEDYAPAYCVGYSGFSQYGGRFEEAEKSLCANFVRIKGDSRLTWEEAIEPIRCAWARREAADARSVQAELDGLLQRVTKSCAMEPDREQHSCFEDAWPRPSRDNTRPAHESRDL